jgi:fibronectin-binding autotransporter adhesin
MQQAGLAKLVRRSLAVIAVAIAPAASVGGVALVTATAAAALPSCNDNWTNGSGGSWSTAGNWSAGVPSGTTDACIKLAGTYTVDLSGSGSASTLLVGNATSGTQTLDIDGSSTNSTLTLGGASEIASGGVLSETPSSSGYALLLGSGSTSLEIASNGKWTTSGTGSEALLRVPLTIDSGGSASIGAPDTLQDSDTLTTNNGSFTVSSGGAISLSSSSSFTQSGGTLKVTGSFSDSSGTFTMSGGTESGNPVTITGGTLADSAGGGSFDVTNSATLSGKIPSGQSVKVDGSSTNVEATLSGTVTDDGTLDLNSTSNGFSMIEGDALTVASGGALTTSGSGSDSYLRVPITIDTGGTVTIGNPETTQDYGTLTTNKGSFTVSSGGAISLSGSSSFTQSGGTLKVTGPFTDSSGTFTMSGGTESGNPVTITGGTLADSAGGGSFDVTNSATLSGKIPSGQSVKVDGSSTNVEATLSGTVTDDGTLDLNSTSNGFSMIEGDALTVASGGAFTTSGSGSDSYLRVPITIDTGGTVTIGNPDTVQDNGTLTTNKGSFTVSSGGEISLSGSSSFTQSGGTLTATGPFTDSSGTFTMSGGTESGNPVTITGGTLADSAGGGSFDVTNSATLSGKIPSGQSVKVDGSSTNVEATLSGTLTDNGTLDLNSTSNGFSMIEGDALTVASGGALTTSGSGSESYLRVPITIDTGGTVTIGNPDTVQDSGTATVNSGTLKVVDGGELTLSSTSTLTNNAGGTLGVTVDASTGAWGVAASGDSVSLAGTLEVTTVGSPTLGNTYEPITGSVTGTFSSFAFGPKYYVVTYPTNEVQVQIEQGFTSSASSFSPAENESITPKVASIAHANDEPGTYSATVNYGDGTGVQPATVNITGATGTVTGPAHTYTEPGTYTVTTVISNTSGTTDTDTKSVKVTGPTITGLSEDTVAPGKELVTVVTGTNFDGTGAPSGFTTSDPTHVTVVSVEYEKKTTKHGAEYSVTLKVSKSASEETLSLTLTQTGSEPGIYTDSQAITVT